MANRVKEDEKNERIIRSLLKLTENRRCINCNSLGPQYVCTNFWTFVCTTCSGIHREFTHRVKSVSMAKFTSQEVAALQAGGNERAKEIYFKEWDPQRNSFPDSSNIDRLREFIKHVYVDRRFTGERNFDKPPRVKTGEDSYENRRTDTYQGGSRSPPYEDTYERRYSERPSPGGRSDDSNFRYNYDERSPGYDRENRQYGDYRRSPVRPEVVNDWRRDDRFGNGRRPEDRRISDGDSKSEGRSPDYQKDLDVSSPPVVRPVREILGDNVSPLRISEPPRANGGRAADGSTHTQSSLGSANGNPVELKRENSGILIDFDADPEPPVSSAVPQTQQTTIGQTIAQPISSSSDNNWASFDFATETKVSQAPSNANTLDSVLSQLFVPAPVPVHSSVMSSSGGALTTAPVSNMSALPISGSVPGPVGQPSMSTFSGGVPAAVPVSGLSMFPPSGAPEAASGLTSMLPVNGGNSFVKVTDAGQWPIMQTQQQSLFPAPGSQPTAQQFTPSVGGASSNQPWISSLASNTQGPLSTPAAQAPQVVSIHAQEVVSGSVSQPSPMEVKTIGRKVLPEDLFTAPYPSFSAPLPGWQTGPPGGMGFAMQYTTAVPMPTFPQSSKSTNPFDLNSEPPPVQAPTFPSMTSLQGALPNMLPPTGLLRASSLGTPSPTWMSPQSSSYTPAMPPQAPSYTSAMPPQAPSYMSAMPPQAPSYMSAMPPQAPSAMPPRPYMGQQIPSNMPPPGHQVVGGFGSEGAAFGSLYSNQQVAGRYSAPATSNSFPSVGGNPFG